MRGILADINVEGQQRAIMSVWNPNVIGGEIWLGLGYPWKVSGHWVCPRIVGWCSSGGRVKERSSY